MGATLADEVRKFVPPRADRLFRRLFGDERDVPVLVTLLDALLDLPAEDLTEITLDPTHLAAQTAKEKEAVVDVLVRTGTGRRVDIEIQLANVPNLPERVACYKSRMLAGQEIRGQEYSQLRQVILVMITDFRLFPDEHLHHRFSMWDREHDVGLTDLEEVHVFELPKLPTEPDGTAQWDWLKFISVRTEEELDMTPTTDPALARAVTIVKHFNSDEIEQHNRLRHDIWEADQASRLGAARREGIAEGHQRGVAERALTSARSALDLGLSVADAAKVSGLSEAEVAELAATPGTADT